MTKLVIYNTNHLHDIKIDHNCAQQLLTRFDGVEMIIELISDLDFDSLLISHLSLIWNLTWFNVSFRPDGREQKRKNRSQRMCLLPSV